MNRQFSQRVSDIIVYSKEEANKLRSQNISPEHLFLGILRDGESKAISVLLNLGIDLSKIKKELENTLQAYSDENQSIETDVELTESSSKILKMSILEARGLKSDFADAEHLLLAILREKNNGAASILQVNNINYKKIMDQLTMHSDMPLGMGFSEESDDEEEDNYSYSDENKEQVKATAKKTANNTPVLDNFGTDMTKVAEEGRLDPVIGRDKEIERLAQILSRRKKNNPILIGEPGVGKSAIVEGLALRIVQKKVSRILFDKRVFTLDLASVVAGTKYRGQFEERIRSILNELQQNPDVILFIDEIHTIIGAGSAPGSMDAANMLKPALARGEIQCIGATTLDEYRKNIEKDGALERRFQKIIVEPTTAEETLQILINIKDKYEDHHNVNYTPEAIEACVKLADRYITDRHFPDKAIDVVDEAGARTHILNINVPKEIEEQEALIEQAKNLKNESVRSQNYELAASYRDHEKNLSEELNQMKLEWENSLKENRQVVTEEDIANVVSMMSGIPVQKMAQQEGVRLASMQTILQSKVIAQDNAIHKLVKAILRSRVGLKDPNRPIGTFMFLGPTGVGKTHLAKELAKFLFGSADALIRIDMSEYMEKFTVSRLVGAPPGYVGYEEGGQLTEKVRRKPYSIILLDEIEKAHTDVFNLLLQVMDEGRLTDSYGRTVDFKNTVIIMTSNIGTRQLKDFGRGIGFGTQKQIGNNAYAHDVILKALNKSFAPEFINRIDELITFDQLSFEAITQIIDLELLGLTNRLDSMGYQLTISDDAKLFIAQKGYDVQYGARPLKRAIQNHLEDKLSEMLVTNALSTGSVIKVTINEEKTELLFTVE